MFDPGRASVVTVGDKCWTVGRLERSTIFAFRDWVRSEVGDVWAALDRVKPYLAPEQLLERVREAEATAKDLACFSLGTATAKRYLATEGGMAKLLQLLMQPAHPDVTEDEAFRVMMALGAEATAQAVADAGGRVPNGEAPAPPGTAALTGTS